MGKAYSVNALLSKKFETMAFENEWKQSFGSPDKHMSMMIMGNSGHGKTEFALQLARYLTQFGKVAYNSIEQGVSATLKQALIRNHMDQVADRFLIIDGENLEEMTARLLKQRSPDFVVIDSLQYLPDADKQKYFEFKNQFKNKKGFIYISHQDGKDPKGALAKDVWFDVDIHVRVEGFTAFPSKRLNGGGQPYIINAERASKYHAEIS